jgi:hypothetical protein
MNFPLRQTKWIKYRQFVINDFRISYENFTLNMKYIYVYFRRKSGIQSMNQGYLYKSLL